MANNKPWYANTAVDYSVFLTVNPIASEIYE